jgi:hypothetical protein
MGEMTASEWRKISEAIVIWTGRGLTSYPQRSEGRLAGTIGNEEANRLLPTLLELENKFYESDARHRAANSEEMLRLSTEWFQSQYPLLSRAAVEALGWCYTWDYK